LWGGRRPSQKQTGPITGKTQSEPSQFPLKEISVFGYEGPIKDRLKWGQQADECGENPNEKVKTYPQLTSQRPLYGSVTFDKHFLRPESGILYCFVLDESAGTGSGYDRFYFDANRDLDLTNDGVLKRMPELPAGAELQVHAQADVFFEQLDLILDHGPDEGTRRLEVIPRFTAYEDGPTNFLFLVPTARTGKISIGPKEAEVVLAQTYFAAGRFDRPTTALFLIGQEEPLGFLSLMRCEQGRFYSLSATPSGDKLTVTPYDGPLGTFDVGGGRDETDADLELGWLHTENAFFDLGTCPHEGRKIRLPAGDYRPFRLAINLGKLRVGVAAKISAPGACGENAGRPPVFGIKVREDKPFLFELPKSIAAEFVKPAVGQPFRAGDEIKVEVSIKDPVMDILIAGLEDTTQKVGESIKLPNGTEYQQYLRLDPTVKIVSSSGECVAQDKLPFG
jgi:hypothetical protein